MLKKSIKDRIILCLMAVAMLSLFSCTKEKRSEAIWNEVVKDDSAISITYDNAEEYKYIINTRTGKVHTYSDGISRVSEKYLMNGRTIVL